MIVLSELTIGAALENVGVGLAKYEWLQANLHERDVRTDQVFQIRLNSFYRVRRTTKWQDLFFSLLEHAKTHPTDFATTLETLYERTGAVEASFASKLVATINPALPVIDQYVLHQFGLRLPPYGASDRFNRTINVYDQLIRAYALVIDSPTGRTIQRLFGTRFPNNQLTPLKKIDLVLWQIR